ncbi:MAG: NAD kinase [Bacteroidales bacterium]|nr:NAD kinase [Bacteroidales bacterium]MDZ4204582.1 NAD kinase [Bacteroidales bacterium]
MKIALYGKNIHPDALSYVQELIDKLIAANSEILFYEPFYRVLSQQLACPTDALVFGDAISLAKKTDLFISLGGDGTLLDTLTLVKDSGIPIMGINLGRMGFLSSISKTELSVAIGQVLAGEFVIDARSLLSLETPQHIFGDLNFALNELTINKKDTTSMILVHVWVDDKFLHSYWADGLIIATPTGSTAYSLSCNGPIITPESANFVITPIATHNLTVRPVVIPDNSTIRIRVEGRENKYLVSLDSRSAILTPNTDLVVKKAEFKVNLLQLKDQYFFRTIREKLSWGKDIRN